MSAIDNWPFFFSFNEWCSKKDRHNQFLNPPAWPHNHQISYWDMRNMPEGLIFFWIIREVCTRSSELFYLVPCSYLELYEFFLKFIMSFWMLSVCKKIPKEYCAEKIKVFPWLVIIHHICIWLRTLLFIEINQITIWWGWGYLLHLLWLLEYLNTTNSKVITEI